MSVTAHSGPPAEDLPDFPVPSHDPRSVADALRPDSAVALSSTGAVVLLRHADVTDAAHDDKTFSSAVSRYRQVPNGLDGRDHVAYRMLIDRYFTPDRVDALEPVVRTVARSLCAELAATAGDDGRVHVEAVSRLGAQFAVRAQTEWLGWPSSLEPVLLEWMRDNRDATRSGDRAQTAAIAERFDEIVRTALAAVAAGDGGTVTDELVADDTLGRPLEDEELVSILRNWTGGDLGSIALCVGVIVQFLAREPEIQQRIRDGLDPTDHAAVLDEILRLDDPFVANRRITRCPVTVGGVRLPEQTRVVLNWTSANRDEAVFGDPDRFDPQGHAHRNVVYGTGRHVCPGRGLSTMELRVLVEELVAAFGAIEPGAEEPQRSSTPIGGYASVPVVLTPSAD